LDRQEEAGGSEGKGDPKIEEEVFYPTVPVVRSLSSGPKK